MLQSTHGAPSVISGSAKQSDSVKQNLNRLAESAP